MGRSPSWSFTLRCPRRAPLQQSPRVRLYPRQRPDLGSVARVEAGVRRDRVMTARAGLPTGVPPDRKRERSALEGNVGAGRLSPNQKSVCKLGAARSLHRWQPPKPNDLRTRKVRRAATLSALNYRLGCFGDPTRASRCLRAHPDAFKRLARFLLSRLLSRPQIRCGCEAKVLYLQGFHAPERTRTSTR
jgi:hypothetical protein